MKYVERELVKEFETYRALTRGLALTGPRQAGKTTFLRHHAPQNAQYLLFDDPDLADLFTNAFDQFRIKYPQEHLILDEIHQVPDAGRRVKYLIDTGRTVWLTDSSEQGLAPLLGALVGRVTTFTLYPFSFAEFVTAKGGVPAERERFLWEHRRYGGYPRVVLATEERERLLHEIAETTLLKDVLASFRLSSPTSLKRLVKHLALLAGQQLSYDTLSESTGLSYRQLKEYVGALEASNLVRTVTPFFTNKQKELVKQPKIYFTPASGTLSSPTLRTTARSSRTTPTPNSSRPAMSSSTGGRRAALKSTSSSTTPPLSK